MAQYESSKPDSRKPPDTAFRQQRLPAWEPIMTPPKVIALFVVLGICFIPTGTTLISNSNNLYENTIVYDKSGSSCTISKNNQGLDCQLKFEFTDKVDGPLYVYYEIDNFFQNHRRYVASLDYYQLKGQNLDRSAVQTSCIGYVDSLTTGQLLNPCGLIANSYFTDVITLTGSSQSSVVLDENDISWKSERNYKYLQVQGFWTQPVSSKNITCPPSHQACKTYLDSSGQWHQFEYPDDATVQYLYESYPGLITPLEGVTNEHFMVWMRTAGLPIFRKLYGRINNNFNKGDFITFNINCNYEVNSFGATKALVITQEGEFGGRNPLLGVSYIVVGSICFFFAALFALKQILAPRDIADPSLLKWE